MDSPEGPAPSVPRQTYRGIVAASLLQDLAWLAFHSTAVIGIAVIAGGASTDPNNGSEIMVGSGVLVLSAPVAAVMRGVGVALEHLIEIRKRLDGSGR